MSRTRPSSKTKPRKKRRLRNLSDPRTLSELALRLKEGIYITTLDGEIIEANLAFLEMFGVESLDDLRAHRTLDFVRPEVRAREMAQLEREGSVRDVEFQLTRRDGEIRTIVDSAFLSIDPDNGEKYCHGILVDITHRKELQTRLLELSIRDPLTGCYTRRYLNSVTRQCEAQPKGEWDASISTSITSSSTTTRTGCQIARRCADFGAGTVLDGMGGAKRKREFLDDDDSS